MTNFPTRRTSRLYAVGWLPTKSHAVSPLHTQLHFPKNHLYSERKWCPSCKAKVLPCDKEPASRSGKLREGLATSSWTDCRYTTFVLCLIMITPTRWRKTGPHSKARPVRWRPPTIPTLDHPLDILARAHPVFFIRPCLFLFLKYNWDRAFCFLPI